MILIFGFIFIGTFLRLLPTPPNFAPIGALALLGGAFLSNKRLAILLPLGALFLSDLIFQLTFMAGIQPIKGFYGMMPFVYLSFIFIVLAGRSILKKVSFSRLVGGGLAASIIFFTVSNFGVWLTGFYTYSLAGLGASYAAAIPFFHYNVLGDLSFTFVLFGAFYMIKSYHPAFQKVTS
ncbi:MAG: hypothetical protein EA412_13245 [Chitinophagaceae bacterium]|nr:MAG: hypothetical protein EA412_13245 [Chitinophagaceae bacterium]